MASRANAESDRSPPSAPVIKGKNPTLSGVNIRDEDPGAAIPSPEQQMKDPLHYGYILQDMLANAMQATKRGDDVTAARYYEALAKAVPTAYGPGMLCETLLKLNERERALAACREAVTRQGVTLADFARLAGILMAKPDPLAQDIQTELKGLSEHIDKDKDAGLEGERVRCNIAVRLQDPATLEACTANLVKHAPEDAVTMSFQWSLAMQKHDFSGAQKVIEHARKAKVPEAAVSAMEDATYGHRKRWLGRVGIWLIGGTIVTALLAVGARKFALSRRRATV
jgi:hypothetical protein